MTPLTALFHSEYHDYTDWTQALARLMPELTVYDLDTLPSADDVDVLLTWTPPDDWQTRYPNLRLVHVLAAGVDHMLGQPFPDHIPLARVIEPQQIQSLFEYLCAGVMYFHREFHIYRKSQEERLWTPRNPVPAHKRVIGIMGLGTIGHECATGLSRLGFHVKGWSRSAKEITGVHTYSGHTELPDFLADCNILVCLLPLNDSTRHILNRDLFGHLPHGACLINLGRGGHCAEDDLIEALSDGQLSAALLDVFATEPLPENSPLWHAPGVTITPHIATRVNTENAAQHVANNLRRLVQGKPLKGLVDLTRGY